MHFARGGNSSLRAVGHHTISLRTTAINGNCYVCMCVCVLQLMRFTRFTSEKISAERFILIFHFDFNPPVWVFSRIYITYFRHLFTLVCLPSCRDFLRSSASFLVLLLLLVPLSRFVVPQTDLTNWSNESPFNSLKSRLIVHVIVTFRDACCRFLSTPVLCLFFPSSVAQRIPSPFQ